MLDALEAERRRHWPGGLKFAGMSVVRPAIEKLDRRRAAIEIDRVTSHGLQCDHTKADKV